MIEIPKDPVVAAYDEKKAELDKLKRERLTISREKEQRRHEFALERQDTNRHDLIDDQGRDLGRAAYEEFMRLLDAQEGEKLREIKKAESELVGLSRQRNKIIVAANQKRYLEILRRRAFAAVEVAKCNEIEAAFHAAMSTAGVSSTLRPMGIKTVGSWNDSQSLARFHIAELREYFPDEFRNENFEE